MPILVDEGLTLETQRIYPDIMTGRTQQKNIRLNEEEWKRLAELAEHFGLDVSSTIRMLVKKEHDRIEKGKAK